MIDTPPAQQRRLLEAMSRAADVGCTMSEREAARRLGVSRARIRQLLQALHARGWLRSPTTDGLHCHHVLTFAADPPEPPAQNGQ